MSDLLRKAYYFVDRTTRLQAICIAALMIVCTLLEAVGIGLVFPLVEAVSDPDGLSRNAFARFIFDIVGETDHQTALIALALMFLGAILFKNAFLLVSFFAQGRFFSYNEALFARRLFAHYLHSDYNILLSRNSSDLINNIVNTTTTIYSLVLRNILMLAIETIMIACVMAVLLMANPIMTLSALALMIVSIGIIYLVNRNRLALWGQRQQKARQLVFQTLQQAFHSIKEVKIFGCETQILRNFATARQEMAVIDANMLVLSNIPRLWIESVAVCGFVGAVAYVVLQGETATGLFSLLALFAAAAFRLIPSFNRILMAMNNLRTGIYAVNTVHADLTATRNKAPASAEAPPLPFNDTIVFENVSYAYPDTETSAASGINLQIRKGEAIGLVGASGAGKTTIADLLLGLLNPSQGRIVVDGQDISENVRGWQKNLSYVPQTVYLSDDSIRRNVAFGIPDEEIDDAQIMAALRLAQLEDFVQTLPEGLDTFVGERGTWLSGGQRQRIGIARALYHDPDVLVLDEATSSLDSEAEHEISTAIDRLSGSKTIIIIAHRLSTLRSCDRLVFMANAGIEDTGSFDTLAQKNSSFKRLVELSKFTG